ncbi:hypothetical protein LCGC14_2034740 [marine sediment metagenome]|uniref:Uncharacterized protein n=1 Tax=marine sediment metagenome TaxID=412755 RepID=A0A0F9HQM1_9ZZZZ
MSTEADRLNRIYDLKDEIRQKRVQLKYLRKKEKDEGYVSHSSEFNVLDREIKEVVLKVKDIRTSLWKGARSKRTYTASYSTPYNRTGRVMPRRGR